MHAIRSQILTIVKQKLSQSPDKRELILVRNCYARFWRFLPMSHEIGFNVEMQIRYMFLTKYHFMEYRRICKILQN